MFPVPAKKTLRIEMLLCGQGTGRHISKLSQVMETVYTFPYLIKVERIIQHAHIKYQYSVTQSVPLKSIEIGRHGTDFCDTDGFGSFASIVNLFFSCGSVYDSVLCSVFLILPLPCL
jgi:hypothetical protein